MDFRGNSTGTLSLFRQPQVVMNKIHVKYKFDSHLWCNLHMGVVLVSCLLNQMEESVIRKQRSGIKISRRSQTPIIRWTPTKPQC